VILGSIRLREREEASAEFLASGDGGQRFKMRSVLAATLSRTSLCKKLPIVAAVMLVNPSLSAAKNVFSILCPLGRSPQVGFATGMAACSDCYPVYHVHPCKISLPAVQGSFTSQKITCWLESIFALLVFYPVYHVYPCKISLPVVKGSRREPKIFLAVGIGYFCLCELCDFAVKGVNQFAVQACPPEQGGGLASDPS
jgi:hypothetical protein